MASKRSLSVSAKRMEEESWITAEQLALIGFAARLGTCIANDVDLTKDGDVREEAQLLMSLLSSKPSSKSLFCEEELETEPHRHQEHSTRDTFRFTCPSLSLKPTSSSKPPSPLPVRRNSSDSDDSIPSLASAPTPAELFGRPLSVDDRNALRLSAEAMARNVMESFDEALKWRSQTWMHAVSRSLVRKEQALLQQLEAEPTPDSDKNGGSNEQERLALEELLNTSEARLILSLQQVAAVVEVMDVKTSFRVQSTRHTFSEDGDLSQPAKKLRPEQYRVLHSMSFQAVLNLYTPAGYTEVMLQAPGTIEGTFVKNAPEEETLTGVVVQVDTSVLATTIEHSSRIVVRAATEACVRERTQDQQDEEPPQQEEVPGDVTHEEPSPELVCMPTPTKSTVDFTDLTNQAAVVTPRHPSPPSVYCDSVENPAGALDLGTEDEEGNFLRTVSPQPKNNELSSYLFTPRSKISVPSLVSPSPTTPLLSKKKLSASDKVYGSSLPTLCPREKPSLPALVEVACAAMRAN